MTKACAGLLLLQSQSTAGLTRYDGCFATRGCTLSFLLTIKKVIPDVTAQPGYYGPSLPPAVWSAN